MGEPRAVRHPARKAPGPEGTEPDGGQDGGPGRLRVAAH